MSLLVVSDPKSMARWQRAIEREDPSIEVLCWEPGMSSDAVTFALCWEYPEGALLSFPNLRCVCSMGAGVDHILRDRQFPERAAIVRLVDASLVESMVEYLSTVAFYYYRNLDRYARYQRERAWRRIKPRKPADFRIGIMGLGSLGSAAAVALSAPGFTVSGWSRSHREIDGVQTYHGEGQRHAFLADLDLLICLLPLTAETRGILSADTFAALPPGARLINVGRGQHLVDEDLLAALDSGQLAGACLDVFDPEPLPQAHPFWGREDLLLTPHISSMTDATATTPQVVDNYRRLREGRPLLNQVDPLRGY